MIVVIDPLEPLRLHQAGRCAVCEEEKRLVVDHDHVTGYVRGLLCSRCNVTEGTKDWPWLRAYRSNPPARAIGLRVAYGRHLPRKVRRPDPIVHEEWDEDEWRTEEDPAWRLTPHEINTLMRMGGEAAGDAMDYCLISMTPPPPGPVLRLRHLARWQPALMPAPADRAA